MSSGRVHRQHLHRIWGGRYRRRDLWPGGLRHQTAAEVKSTASVVTVPAVRPGAVWYFQ